MAALDLTEVMLAWGQSVSIIHELESYIDSDIFFLDLFQFVLS